MSFQIPAFSRRPFLWGALGYMALNLLLFGDLFWVGNDQVLSSAQTDIFFHFASWRQFAFDQLRQGHLVLWNPHYLCGVPFLGGFEAALLYPPNWLFMVLPLGEALNLGIVLHVILAGFLTYLWALQRGQHPLAAFIAGVIFMWGGAYYLHLFAGHLPNLCVMAWTPLLFLCIDQLIEKASMRWILWGILAVSMQILAGHPQYVYFTAIIAWIYCLISLKDTDSKVRLIVSLAAVYLGASLLTAVQLWTGFEAFQECGRNIPLETNSAESFSFPPENVLTLFLPDFFGNLTTAAYWGRWFLWEVSIYMSVTGFFLAVLGVVLNPSARKGRLLAVTGFAFLFSLGAFTPLYHFFYLYVPFFKSFRGVCKFDYLTALFLALLAGMGMDPICRRIPLSRWVRSASLSAGVLLTVLGFWIYRSAQNPATGFWGGWFTSVHWLEKTVSVMGDSQKQSYVIDAGLQAGRALGVSGGIFLLMALILWLLSRKQGLVYALAGLCVLELFVFARSNRPTFDLEALEKKFETLQDFHSKNPGDYRVYGTGSASLVSGMDDIWEDEPMVLGRYGRFVCRSQNLRENQLFSVVPIFQKFPPVLGMLRLKYRIFMNEDPIRIASFPFKRLPRMQLMKNFQVIPNGTELLGDMMDAHFDPSRQVFLESVPSVVPGPEEVKGTVSWKDLSTDQIEIRADLPQAELLLITDNYSDGWHAKALPGSDQDHYEVMPADYCLRAVPLSKGSHHFLLEYRPVVFEVGKWVSIVSCILYVVAFLLDARRKVIPTRTVL